MVGLKRNSKGSKFSMKTTPAAVPPGDPPLGFKRPPTLIDEKTIDPSVIALRAKNYAAAYADPLMRQKWNMYVSFGIQQFVSPHDYIAHRAQETVEERNLRLARYYRYHLENLAPVDSYLIRTIGAVESTLAISHPGFLSMSTSDMDKYMASMPHNITEMDSQSSPNIHEVAATNDDGDDMDTSTSHPTGSSLAIAAAKTRSNDPSESSTHESEEFQTQEEVFKPVPTTPKRSNKSSSDTETTDESTAMMVTTTEDQDKTDTEMIPATESPLRKKEHEADDVSKDINSEDTPGEYFGVKPIHPIPPCDVTDPIVEKHPPRESSPSNNRRKNAKKTKEQTVPPTATPALDTPNYHPPKSVEQSVRIEGRWAPNDFHELRASKEKMFSRLAPILSCFNTQYTWMLEWQTDQMEDSADIDPKQLAKYLSIRIVPVVKERAFYFSFRICATGSQFTQVAKSAIMKTAKSGERMSFDPTLIPPQQGELMFVGDILLKDASNTHRGHYLRYLRKEVLPEDTPAFDIKVRHKDPVGNSVKILAVRCGKASSTKVAEILSTALCGEGNNAEIFISRLAIGANQTSKKEHERIYQVHMDYLKDIVRIPFPIQAIDTLVTEYLETGPTTTQTPRQWAKSLVTKDGASLEIDLENGTADGSAIILAPSASAAQAKIELNNFWKRQNPSLSNAKELYTASLGSHPDIPKTVFTKNIHTILAKKFSKPANVLGNEDATSPASSLTGATSKSSTIAWKTPLQETLKQNKATKTKPMSSTEINQLKRIAILEAQLALHSTPEQSVATSKASQSTRSKQSTKASRASSQASDQSPLTAATAHSRLDSLEDAMHDIRKLLKKIVTHQVTSAALKTEKTRDTPDDLSQTEVEELHPATSEAPSSPTAKSMTGVVLFPPEPSGDTTLALLSTPKKPGNKRQKPTSSPPPSSNSRLQYTEPSGACGGNKC